MNSSSSNNNEAALHAIDYWQVIKNRYGIILLTLCLVFLTAGVITYLMPKKFQSEAVIEIKPRNLGLAPFGASANNLRPVQNMTPQDFGTEFEKISSRNSLMRVVEKLQLTNNWGVDRETALSILKNIVATQNIRGTNLISITVRHEDPEDAKNVAEEVANAYRDYRISLESSDTLRNLEELNTAVRNQEDKVEEARKLVNKIIRQKGIRDTGDRGRFVRQESDEEMEARSALEQYNLLITEKTQLESQIQSLLKNNTEELILFAAGLELPDGNTIKTIYPQFLEAKLQLDSLKTSGLGPRHPSVQAASEMIQGMRRQMEGGVVSLRATLNKKLEIANDNLKAIELRKDATKQEAIMKGIETQDYNDAQNAYDMDVELLNEMRIKQVGEVIASKTPPDSILIHEEPVIANSYVTPKVSLNLALGLVLGLIFGLGIAFFLEYLDTSVKSLEDVERYLQVPVLAVIPKDVGILHKQSGMSPDAEAYRILRTNIEFNRKNPEDNAITVVSGGAGEGKSTTLVNLAYICAQGGYTTLMIDADLRRPRLHTFFDINNSVGLTNFLTTELLLEDVILQTPVDNLFFMPSGILPADAAGILNSRRMSELIQDVKQRFDLVLIDSPPILGVSDASVLASEVDLTMIVVQHRKLPRNMLVRVKQAVENVGGNVIGVVLNNVDVRSDSQYQYYTSYYTYYAPAESQIGPSINAKSQTAAKQDTVAAARPGNDSELY
ncbi:MAG: polysaccharide biosynthesis tyrosine autokinase [Verrucomicrobia bacterium]|nr:MAG: polysaccharide biosynthesis tyrosine autokinase [Verrucomicrobiota bacterium]